MQGNQGTSAEKIVLYRNSETLTHVTRRCAGMIAS